MDDGRRERIMIACAVPDTERVLSPAGYYGCDRIYLIHDASDAETFRAISGSMRAGTEIEERTADTSDVPDIVRCIHGIIDSERMRCRNSDIFVNLSGTTEYTAASTAVSMMFPGTVPFTVPDGREGRPKVIPRFETENPDRRLILGLRILSECTGEGRKAKGIKVIELLKRNGLWCRFNENGDPRIDSVYYGRDFVSKWMEKGWVYRDEYSKGYELTESGRQTVEMFYCEGELELF